jgi:glycosyltransferase involved in cell wall biosynthesis
MPPSIAVVVPVYNRAHIVMATLESVAGQSLLPTRLIVVDDGSTDQTAAQVERWLAEHKGLLSGRLVRQPNRGPSAARNRGLTTAGVCTFVTFLDSDDRWPTDFLERTSTALVEYPTAVAASCDREQYCGKHHGTLRQDLTSLAAAPIKWILRHGAGIASTTLFRTAAVVERGGFDEDLLAGEDAALFLRLSLDGPWLHVPGRPVFFNRDLKHGDGPEGNLSHKYRDNYRRWARVYEDFILSAGGHRAIAASEYRKLLAKVWYRAGRELTRGRSFREARDCYLASLGWNRFSYKTWQWLTRTYLGDIHPSRLSSLRRQEATGPRLARFDDEADCVESVPISAGVVYATRNAA